MSATERSLKLLQCVLKGRSLPGNLVYPVSHGFLSCAHVSLIVTAPGPIQNLFYLSCCSKELNKSPFPLSRNSCTK